MDLTYLCRRNSSGAAIGAMVLVPAEYIESAVAGVHVLVGGKLKCEKTRSNGFDIPVQAEFLRFVSLDAASGMIVRRDCVKVGRVKVNMRWWRLVI
jgi:hypothetical protein